MKYEYEVLVKWCWQG